MSAAEKAYEVRDPSVGLWVQVFGVCNAWAAVRAVLECGHYDPATFGEPRVFSVRYPNPEDWSYSSVRVVVPPPRFEVQIGPRDGNGPWSAAPKSRAT